MKNKLKHLKYLLILPLLVVAHTASAFPTSTMVQNLFISGLGSAGSPCLNIGTNGLVATSTCGTSTPTTTINGVSGPTFTFSIVATTSDSSITTSSAQLFLNLLRHTSSSNITISSTGTIVFATTSISQWANDAGYITTSTATSTITASGGTATGPSFTFASSGPLMSISCASVTCTFTTVPTSTILSGYSTSTSANPSASVGLTAVNGSANTFMRSDGAPALSQAIAPTWTDLHTYTGGLTAQSTTTLSSTTYLGASSTYDATNERLGLGILSPAYRLDVSETNNTTSSGAGARVVYNLNLQATSTANQFGMLLAAQTDSNALGTITGLAGMSGLTAQALNNVNGITLSTLTGGIFQSFVGPGLGAANGNAGAVNVVGGNFQAFRNSTGSVANIIGGTFNGKNQGTAGTTSNVYAGYFLPGQLGGGSTATNVYGLRIATVDATFGSNQFSSGTVTNAYGLSIDGYPGSGSSFTNRPIQLRLLEGSTTTIAIQQLGAGNTNRLQGNTIVGANNTPSTTLHVSAANSSTLTVGASSTTGHGCLKMFSASGTVGTPIYVYFDHLATMYSTTTKPTFCQ